jgi:superfamily II DNA/RNA helicase
MFSATFAGHVGRLAERLTRNSQMIDVASHTDRHDNIEQRLHLADTLGHKNDLLDHLLTTREVDQAVVFTSTQRDADMLADRLADMGHAVAALHGGLPQGRRTRVLQALRMKQLKILVATDVAARGIDVPTITHVINYGMPMKPEDYVHRIGRTGRAGRAGLAITIAERRDIPMVRRIERFTTQRIPESTIAGLEPKMRAPSDSRGPARGGKPAPGQRQYRDDRGAPRFGANREGGFGGGGNGGGYRGSRDEGSSDRGGYGAPRGDFAPRQADRPFGDRPSYGDRPAKPFGDRPAFGGDRPSYGDRPAFGDKKPFGGKPSFGKPGFKAGGPKPGFGGNKRPGQGRRED